MKKRLISFLLMLVMLVSLCSVIPVSASADAQVTTVTVASGDTVLSICQKLGVDFYTYKDLIMKLNGFTSDAAFSKISVGTKLSLPISNAAAAALAGGTVSSTTTGTTTAGTTSSGLVSGTVSSLPTGDHVAYYLATYTVQSGETLGGIYARWGLSYKTYANQIVKLNNLSSVNAIQAGKTLVLPTTNPSIAGSAYTTVMAHTMLAGENAYNIICSDYGLNYTSALTMLQALNNRTNMGAFRVGEVLYIPVSGVVSSTTTVTPGGSTTTGTVSTTGAYNLVSQTPTNGSFDLQVDGKSAKSAAAGKTVTVSAIPDEGYAVDTIKVTKVGDASTVTTVTNNSFVMPAYSAIVSVTFKQSKQSNITVDAAANGAVSVMVDNSSVTKAYAGAKVTVRTTPDSGFMLDNVRVTYNDYRDTIAVENSTFTMPNFPVTVTATFKVDPNYNPASGSKIFTEVTNATITAKVGEKTVDSANAGERVTLSVKPNDNYVLESIKVYYDNFKKTIALDKMTFTMPDEPVTVVAVVKPTADAVFALNVVENTEGTVKLTVDGKEVTSAKAGQTVKIEGSSSKAFYNYLSYVTKSGDSSVRIAVDNEKSTFVMPAHDVEVVVQFYIYRNIIFDNSNSNLGQFATFSDNGTLVTRCGAGVILNVKTWNVKSGMAAGNITITYADGSTYTLTDTSSFVMPDCDIRVRVDFDTKLKLVAHPISNTDGKFSLNCGNTYSVLGITLNDKDKDGYTRELWACRGKTVTITPNLVVGFNLEGKDIKLIWTDPDTNKKEEKTAFWNYSTNQWQIQLPDNAKISRMDLYVSVSEKASYAVTAVPENKDNEKGYVKFTTALGTATKVAPGAIVWMRGAAYEGYNLDWNNVVILNAETGEVVTKKVNYDPTGATFTMPSYPVKVDFTNAYTTDVHTITYDRIDSELDGTSYIAKGKISVTIDSVTYDKFSGADGQGILLKDGAPMDVKAGTGVIVTHEALAGYTLEKIVVKTESGADVKFTSTSDYSGYFTMPFEDVIITPQYTDETFSVIATEAKHGTFKVPAIAKVNPGAEISDIKPEEGYEVTGIYASYTSGSGVELEREAVTARSESGNFVFVPSDGKLPKSAVTIEVEFAAKEQKGLTIHYLFDDDEIGSVSSTNNYWVDIIVDSKTQDIDRSVDLLGLTDRVVDGSDVKTGKSVIIKRHESNADARFVIENIWVLYDKDMNAADQYTNGEYWFTMPNVESGKACEIYVKYALKDSEKYTVLVNSEGADVYINDKLIPNGEYAYLTLGNASIVSVKAQKGYDLEPITASINGVDVSADVASAKGVDEYAFIIGSSDSLHPVMSLPEGNVELNVKLNKSPATEYAVTKSDPADSTYSLANEGAACNSGDLVSVGTNVVIAPADGKLISEVSATLTADGNALTVFDNGDGTYKFTMPYSDVIVTATTKDKPVPVDISVNADKSLTIETKGIYDGKTTYQGECVEVKATMPATSYDMYTRITVEIDGKETKAITEYPGEDSNATIWQFMVPDTAKSIEVTVDYLYNKHDIEVTYGVGSKKTDGVIIKNAKDKVVTAAGTGDTVTIIAPDAEHYYISAATVTYTSYEIDKDGNIKDKEITLKLGDANFKSNADGNIELTLGKLKESTADAPVNIKFNVFVNKIPVASLPSAAALTTPADAPAADAGVSVDVSGSATDDGSLSLGIG